MEFRILGPLEVVDEELGLGRSSRAIVQLEKLARQVAEHGLKEPSVVQWAPELIEAYVRVGAHTEADSALLFASLAEATERTWARAAAARCRGLLASGDDFEPEFERALALHELTPTPFERARTQLCRDERLRRSRRRAEAREPLHDALKTIESHLERVYRKLNVRSRTELAHVLGSGDALSAA